MPALRIYLDYNASTPIDPVVVAAMHPFLEDHYVIHRAGIGLRSGQRPLLRRRVGRWRRFSVVRMTR
jgi:hypothetical protein